MWPPDEWNDHPLTDPATGKPMNHPANLRAVYRFAEDHLGTSLKRLQLLVEANFHRLFASSGN